MKTLQFSTTYCFVILVSVLASPAAWGYCDAVADGVWDAGAAGIEQQALAEINAMRQRGANCGGEDMPPVPPLRMDSRLQCAARNHAMDLGTQGFENHMNPNEPDQETPAQRVALAGYPHQVLENISWGYDTAAAVVNQHWANSPGHCKNLMTPNDDIIGVGFYGGGYWTIVIGKNR